MQISMKNKKISNVIWILVGIEILLMVIFCFNPLMWDDESLTLEWAMRDFLAPISTSAGDSHPPVYYWALKLWCTGLQFTGSHPNCLAKLLSTVPYILILTVGSRYVQRKMGSESALTFSFMVFFMPKILYTCVEARMYSWGILWTLLAYFSGMFLWENGIKKKTPVILLIFAGIMSAYTHYTACMAIIGIYIVLFVLCVMEKRWGEVRCLVVSAAISSLCFLPWLIFLFGQVERTMDEGEFDYLILNFRAAIGFVFSTLALSCNDIIDAIMVVLNVCAIVIIFAALWQNRETRRVRYLMGGIVPVILVGVADFVLSHIAGHTFYGARQLMFGIAVLYVSLALGIPYIGSKWKKRYVSTVYIGIGLLNGLFFSYHEIREMVTGIMTQAVYFTF